MECEDSVQRVCDFLSHGFGKCVFFEIFCGADLLTFAQDENALIWYSGREEKKLWLSTVSRIIPGQRTVSIITKVLHNASPCICTYV